MLDHPVPDSLRIRRLHHRVRTFLEKRLAWIHFSGVAVPSLLLVLCSLAAPAQTVGTSPGPIDTNTGLHPNLQGKLDKPLRYHPENGDFVIENGEEFFNRSLYGGNTAFRADGGDKPEFMLYLPGRGGNLRLGIRTGATALWLQNAAHIVTRYRPGELIYTISDPTLGAHAVVELEVLAYAVTEGLVIRAHAKHMAAGTELVWAYGGVNGKRGARDGDIGTERVPISEYFQFQPALAEDNSFKLQDEGFTLHSQHATIVGITPTGTRQHIADATQWDHLPALLSNASPASTRPIVVGVARLSGKRQVFLSLQRITGPSAAAVDLGIYREVTKAGSQKPQPAPLPPPFKRADIPDQFAAAVKYFQNLRNKVRIETPDPWLDAAQGSLNVVTDALWDTDAHAIMHGSIAWRTKLLGWRGPYALDALGWHDRARENFGTWLPTQNSDPIPLAPPPADPQANLARNEPGLHSNGDLSHSHYDMNMVFIDALFRHLLWTGDETFARETWPVIKRHMAWERRLFRREYGPAKLPLYEAYATLWASDDLYYSGGGSAYASAYNVYANRMAARIALLAGEDPKPYAEEAAHIEDAMRRLLWLPQQGTFAEYKDLLGKQRLHTDYGLWNFYHTVDEEAVTRREAWLMGADLITHLRPIPVTGPAVPHNKPYYVLSETDWMPYSWSINNVVMDENIHAALGLWQSGHSDEAYTLAKGALLASMYMGISPGNVGTMNYLDVYRRESQRDFGDSAGTLSRALVEGLFGVHPDALSHDLTLVPGFPKDWTHARLTHPDLSVDFRRSGLVDTWHISQPRTCFRTLTLRLPASFSGVASVHVNGLSAPWHADLEATGGPALEVVTPLTSSTRVEIVWTGEHLTSQRMSSAESGPADGDFTRRSLGAFTWWVATPKIAKPDASSPRPVDWHTVRPNLKLQAVDLSRSFNDRVSNIFAPGKYLSPRSPSVSLALPSQGVGAWAGHLNALPVIDDTGLRNLAGLHGDKVILPNGISFSTPSTLNTNNILFTSQWDNYPHEATIALTGQAVHAYFLMAGSTNFMQSRMDNGELIVTYTDGTSARLALRNPETWWPIEQDYFIDDYQFPLDAPLPPRIDLKTGTIRLLELPAFKGKGREVPGGAATVLDLPLDPSKRLSRLTVRSLANDVVIGLMSATLVRRQ